MVSQATMDLGIFQDTKVTDGIYTRGYSGYNLIAMGAPVRHCGVIAVFYRPAPYFTVDSV